MSAAACPNVKSLALRTSQTLLGSRRGWVPGFPSMITGVTTLTVYLRPDMTSERVSRGRMLHLVANDAPVVSTRSDWSVKGTLAYAYVPLVGPTGEIAGDQDLAWPFAVDGGIDDETLISLVTFVRSRPPIPGVPEGQAPRQVASAPLFVVRRLGDQFMVVLRRRGGWKSRGSHSSETPAGGWWPSGNGPSHEPRPQQFDGQPRGLPDAGRS